MHLTLPFTYFTNWSFKYQLPFGTMSFYDDDKKVVKYAKCVVCMKRINKRKTETSPLHPFAY